MYIYIYKTHTHTHIYIYMCARPSGPPLVIYSATRTRACCPKSRKNHLLVSWKGKRSETTLLTPLPCGGLRWGLSPSIATLNPAGWSASCSSPAFATTMREHLQSNFVRRNWTTLSCFLAAGLFKTGNLGSPPPRLGFIDAAWLQRGASYLFLAFSLSCLGRVQARLALEARLLHMLFASQLPA